MISTCRSCGARIVFALTEAGKRMPVDVEPSSEKGNLVLYVELLDGEPLDAPAVHRVRPATLEERQLVLDAIEAHIRPPRLWISHFATCPKGPAWRRKHTAAKGKETTP